MEINTMISEYNKEKSFNYTPLKISVDIIPPLCLTNQWIHFDSVLTYLCMRDCLGEDFYSLPTEKTINISNLRLPLKQTDDVYHASVGIFDKAILKRNTIYKRFTDKETRHLTKKQQRGRIKTNQGHFKDFMINLPYILTEQIIFYCCGDKDELSRLLNHLSFIGKKSAIGCGRIRGIHIEDTEEDYSFYRDGEVMRTIPSSFKIPLFEGMRFERQPYKAPYWDKSNVTMCYVPKPLITV